MDREMSVLWYAGQWLSFYTGIYWWPGNTGEIKIHPVLPTNPLSIDEWITISLSTLEWSIDRWFVDRVMEVDHRPMNWKRKAKAESHARLILVSVSFGRVDYCFTLRCAFISTGHSTSQRLQSSFVYPVLPCATIINWRNPHGRVYKRQL